MLKYSVQSDEGSFSPSQVHRHDNDKTLMKETIEVNNHPGSRTKMVMRKRAKHVQRRVNDFALFPPISRTPQNQRKEVPTPYMNHSNGNEMDPAYINELRISRMNDVTTPYVFHSHFSKADGTSPLPQKEYSRVSHISHGNVVEVNRVKHEKSFSHESINKVGASSPYIERRSRLDHTRKNTRKQSGARDQKNRTPGGTDTNEIQLQVQSNQMGLLQRSESFKIRHKENRTTRQEEPFSIRKKIEQFRKWHEEQYKDKLKRLKEEVDNQFVAEQKRVQSSVVGKDSPPEPDQNGEKYDKPEKKHKLDSSRSSKLHNAAKSVHKSSTDDKATSEHTWHTWRDVNDSYAYSNVKKYIDDNDLMNKEKEDWIRKWIREVDKAMQSSTPEENVT